jgi:hypothetical protein
MGYSNTFIIPKEPDFVPNNDQAVRAKAFLDMRLDGIYSASLHWSLTPRLYSTGESWRSFTCPKCRKLVKYDYEDKKLSDWWYMSLYCLHEPDQVVTVPCCSSHVAGREFDFGMDAAFSRFAIEIENLHMLWSGYFNEDDIKRLEEVSGFNVRIIIEQGT